MHGNAIRILLRVIYQFPFLYSFTSNQTLNNIKFWNLYYIKRPGIKNT